MKLEISMFLEVAWIDTRSENIKTFKSSSSLPLGPFIDPADPGYVGSAPRPEHQQVVAEAMNLDQLRSLLSSVVQESTRPQIEALDRRMTEIDQAMHEGRQRHLQWRSQSEGRPNLGETGEEEKQLYFVTIYFILYLPKQIVTCEYFHFISIVLIIF